MSLSAAGSAWTRDSAPGEFAADSQCLWSTSCTEHGTVYVSSLLWWHSAWCRHYASRLPTRLLRV